MFKKILLLIAVMWRCGYCEPARKWASRPLWFIQQRTKNPCRYVWQMKAYVLARSAAANSYLNIPNLISAAAVTGCDAVHPGVGFLAENADFADIVQAHGLTFIGPEPDHIRQMGDKVQAKITAASGLPLVPGSPGAVPTLEEAKKLAMDIGFPLLVKAASGGGGRGMKVAASADDLAEAFSSARSE